MFNTIYAYYDDNWIAWHSIFSDWVWNAMSFWDFLLLAISVIIFIGFILSIVFILWWGLLLILSGGKEERTKPAINIIRYSILWIFITVWAIFLAPILWKLLWVSNISKFMAPQAIYERITSLWDKMFWDDINSPSWSSDIYDWKKRNLGDLDF